MPSQQCQVKWTNKKNRVTINLRDSHSSLPSLEMSLCVHSVCQCGKQRSSKEVRDQLMKIVDRKSIVGKNKGKYYLNLNSVEAI